MTSVNRVLLALVICAAGAGAALVDAEQQQYDVLIRGGIVIDGSGAPGRQANVLVRDGRIARVGKFNADNVDAKRTIDASGMVVTPGFIDAHSHGDPMGTPGLGNFLAMGVTTICVGQDGESPADLAGWMRRVEQTRPGVNIATFVGHGTVRELAGVGLQTDPSPEQIAAMQSLVHEAMDEGCLGLSTGLEYQPGSFATLDELVALAKPVAAAGGLVMSHMRSEDDDKIEGALNELLAQGRGAGCPVHVSHIKVTYGHGVERAEWLLSQMQAARDDGQRVTADIYPYTASYTGIGIVFPDWAKPPNDYNEVVRTRRAELAAYLRHRVTQRNGPEATLFGTGRWAGKTLAQVADELGKPFEDVLIDDIGLGNTHAAYFVMDEALQQRLLVDPHVMISSDGGATSRHPRGYGAFARVIRKFVVESKVLPLEEAVHKMTGLTAETVGLDKLERGRLAEGWTADVLVFDPTKVRDNATYDKPQQLATGFDWVIVNGQIVREHDKPTGARAGRMLRRAASDVRAATARERTSAMPPQRPVASPDFEQKVGELMKPFDAPDAPGATIAIYRDGKLAFTHSYGLADLENHTPADEHTNYRIASMTKQFTATCIMMLKQRGALDYDDPITRFFPDFPAIGKQITVRQLLWHTSGLIDYEDLIPPGQTEQLKDRDVLELLETQQGSYFTPGAQYRYSNSGYAVLAMIVEKASGTDFATFLRDNIFDPLGMTDTVAYEKGISTVPHRAMGYRQTEHGFVDADQSLTSAVLGDGGIYTSVTDYLKWDRALDSAQLVGREAINESFTPGQLADGTPTIYGFGWRIEQRHGRTVIHHNGGTCGFNSAVRRVPDRRLTLVIFANRAGDQAHKIADELLDWFLTSPDENVPQPQEVAESNDNSWHWTDAQELRIEGKGWADTQRPYQRLPHRAQDVVTPDVWKLSQHSAGICVRFITDSPQIAATWDGGRPMAHMAATGNCGLDLYRRDGDTWVFCGVGKPGPWTTTATLARGLPNKPTEYLLYLPLYHSVSTLKIGIQPGSEIHAAAPHDSKPIVFYGTSITQGGCASRAGMCHAAILGRRLNREVINLGFSGSGKMEPAMADLLGQLDAAAYVLECLPNMTTDMVRERVVPFVHRLRKERPLTPILLVESPLHPRTNVGNKELRTAFETLKAEGNDNLYYLPGDDQLAGGENGTVDGVHPTDLGFDRMAAVYEPVLRRILDSSATAKLKKRPPADDALLPGFERSPCFDERVRTYAFDPDVTVHINAPSPASFDPSKPTRLVLYALPNGNTIAQTIGKQRAPDVDWHFFIQHIGAQTRRIREVLPNENLVVAYLQADSRSWPLWRKKHENSGELIAQLIDSIRSQFPGNVSVELASHSGGGSLIFGYLNHVEQIPDWITRIVLLDADYSYSDEQHHGDKLIAWLQRSPEHFLGVVAYDDRRIRLNGKLVVGPTGGTYRATQRMLNRLRSDLTFDEAKEAEYTRCRALAGRVDVIVVENPDDKILHTVLVEKNGFIHGLTFGTPLEDKAGRFWGPAAYTEWIQPD